MPEYTRVIGDGGVRGIVLGPSDEGPDSVAIELDSGREISVPASTLKRGADGNWYITTTAGRDTAGEWEGQEETVVPVLAEELNAGVRKKPVSTVRVQKHFTEHVENVSTPLERERAEVKRVVIDRPVNELQPIRREGDTIIMPVVEEVPVVEKRLVLKEEIHVTRRRRTEQHEATVTLRREHADVSRVDTSGRPLPISDGSQEGAQGLAEPLLNENGKRPFLSEPGLLGPRPRTLVRRNKVIKED